MGDQGFKVSRAGKDVLSPLAELDKKDFQLISTDGALLETKKDSSFVSGKMFLGYNIVLERYQYVEGEGWQDVPLDEEDIELRPLNYNAWTDTLEKVYVNYENPF